jgi:hypothetical protein
MTQASLELDSRSTTGARASLVETRNPYAGRVRRCLALTLLVALSGCGTSEQQKVVAAIRASDAAWDRGDLDAGCAWLTERARSAFLQDSPDPGARSCSEAFAVVEEQQVAEFGVAEAELVVSEPARMTSVRVNGDTAVVNYSDGEQRRLRKIHGRWLIDSY